MTVAVRTLDPDTAPGPLPPTHAVDVPETFSYRVKKRFLGPPLATDELENERLGIPTGLAVFSSDAISSSAYATEEILRVLIPVVGLGAFSLVVPATGMMLVVLFFLILSYRQTIKEYPTAGGAYMVTRDNFGMVPALVAGVSLLIDYVLTVAVSSSAGAAALASAFPVFKEWLLPITLFFIALVAFGNLKGVRESGKVFSIPTYLFMVMMGLVIAIGMFKMATGGLHAQSTHQGGMLRLGSAGDGLLMGAGLIVFLHAFASGGAAMTGVEAISNGVTAFRKVEWKNARKTLVLMGVTLGTAFLGLSVLSTRVHAVPFDDGTPTVISQVGKQVFGPSALGSAGYFILQAATMLILVMAANTSFADFPRLASFAADDNFLPRQLRRRGHRLVFSNGIISLAAVAVLLVLVTGASVARLIPLYAIGVFTSFTLSQAGMAKHHVTRKEPGWRSGLVVNGVGAVLSGIVLVIFAATKFTEGAWVVIVLVPVFVVVLVRLNRQYVRDDALLERDAEAAVADPVLRRHVVLVFVERLDRATARAIQYARTLAPDEMRAVHIAWDRSAAERLAREWVRLGLTRVPLELVDCPDRRVARGALEVVAAELSGGDTEVSVLLPHRNYRRFWHRFLHDNTAEEIAEAVGRLEHANVTTVPFTMGSPQRIRAGALRRR